VYERRLKIFLSLVGAGMVVILSRLVYMQCLNADRYRDRVQRMLTVSELLPTVRGQILDRNGRVLAVDQACYDFCLDYRMLTEDTVWMKRQVRRLRARHGLSSAAAERLYLQRVARTWQLAGQITGATRNEMAQAAGRAIRRVRAIRRIVGGPVREERRAHPVAPGLDEPTAVALRGRLEEMIGASVRPSHRRWYPQGHTACHVIGRLGPAGGDEARFTHLLEGDAVGRSGVEKACETILCGRRGFRRQRRTGEIVTDIAPQFGADVHLTLDIDLQQRVARLLARPGAAIVLDVPTGEVLAMASLPTYDLNRYQKDFRRLAANEADLPLWNRSVAVRYPPGSTFKPLIALAGLSHGVINPHTTINCPGWLVSPSYPHFRCWIYKKYSTGHGPLDLVGALENSCNIFFYKLGEWLGVRRQVEWLGSMGFTEPAGTGLPEGRASVLPDPARVRSRGPARLLPIGQGLVTTPMHVASAIAAIARGGEFRSPLLIRQLSHNQKVRKLPLTAQQVQCVRDGMYKVVNSATGTAHRGYKPELDPRTKVCGKTGTATTPGRRADTDGDGRPDTIVRVGDTAWFVGFAPARKPRIAFAVVVEYSQAGGGETCGPIARKIVQLCRQKGYL